MKRNLLVMGTIAVFATGIADAKECKGVNFPDQVQVEGSNLTLNGLGLRKATALKVNVYVAALYVAKPSNDPNAILGSNAPTDVNGAVKGTIKGDDFARALLSIWLGAEPPNQEIKSGLLGGACG